MDTPKMSKNKGEIEKNLLPLGTNGLIMSRESLKNSAMASESWKSWSFFELFISIIDSLITFYLCKLVFISG